MARAWPFQDARQKKKLGEAKCPWSVGWIDPDRVRHSKKIGSKSMAVKYARKLEGELLAGVYQAESRKMWADFREEYEAKIVPRLASGTQRVVKSTLDHFERIVKPARVQAVKTSVIDDYVRQRRTEPGKKRGSLASPATVNRELRHLKSALNIACDWGYLPAMPKVRMLKEPKKLPGYVTPEHFAVIYRACDVAVRPKGLACSPSDWWRALLTFNYMTGWRISEPLALRWDDVSLDAGQAITCYDDNKGDRDDVAPLHPIVVEHLRRIVDTSIHHAMVFPWPHHERTLWSDFGRIQQAAGIDLPCREKHEHTPACHLYGFHDLRRAFATQNAETLSADALQALMRHKSYTTTQRYINISRQVNRAVEKLHVPEVLRGA